MNAEPRGAADRHGELDPADAQLHERLARRFDAALAQAERDYPDLSVGSEPNARRAPASRSTQRRPPGAWPRLASAAAAVGILAVAGLIGVGLASKPAVGPGPASVAPEPPATIPAEIDGQKVQTLAESEWMASSESFLLRAYVVSLPIPCPAPLVTPSTTAEIDMVPDCGTIELVPQAEGNNNFYFALAPRTAGLLTPWIGGPEIVIRAHTHDPEAQQCGSSLLASCEGALVVEAVVWPTSAPVASPTPTPTVRPSETVPDQIAGQKVYTMAERSQWANLADSFYLYASIVRHAPACLNVSIGPAEDDLVGGTCGWLMLWPAPLTNPIDSVRVAPRTEAIFRGWIGGPAAVLRVHTHDPEAARCTADYRAACEAAVVIEAVAWPEIPTHLDGENVYRSADRNAFPTDRSFLLGGPFTESGFLRPCVAPFSTNSAEWSLLEVTLIDSCEGLYIDGLRIAPLGSIREPNGEVLVARVHIHDPLAAQCAPENQERCEAAIVVESVVWRSTVLSWPTPMPSNGGDAGPSPSAGVVVSAPPPPLETPVSSPDVILGPDGMPVRYEEQTVYTVAEVTSGNVPDGSFLLSGYTQIVPIVNGCSPLSDRPAEIRQALYDPTMDGAGCDPYAIGSTADGSSSAVSVAPKSPVALDQLFRSAPVGPIVMRVYLNDPEAAQCGEYRDACASSLVIEAVVWGELPFAPDSGVPATATPSNG
jgi:hypothetical protein